MKYLFIVHKSTIHIYFVFFFVIQWELNTTHMLCIVWFMLLSLENVQFDVYLFTVSLWKIVTQFYQMICVVSEVPCSMFNVKRSCISLTINRRVNILDLSGLTAKHFWPKWQMPSPQCPFVYRSDISVCI